MPQSPTPPAMAEQAHTLRIGGVVPLDAPLLDLLAALPVPVAPEEVDAEGILDVELPGWVDLRPLLAHLRARGVPYDHYRGPLDDGPGPATLEYWRPGDADSSPLPVALPTLGYCGRLFRDAQPPPPLPPVRLDRPAARAGLTRMACVGGCGGRFDSKDPSRNRLCPRCNARNAAFSRADRTPARAAAGGDGPAD